MKAVKKVLWLLALTLFAWEAPAQLLKNIGEGIKRDVEYKIERKARNTANRGIDTLVNKSTKAVTKKKHKKENKESGPDMQNAGGTSDEKKAPEQGEGYITLALSTPVTTKGLSVIFSGESIKHKDWKTVKIEVKGPRDKDMSAPLNDSGIYRIKYDCLEEGDYEITATSSNGKTFATQKLVVLDWGEPKEETVELEKVSKEAFDLLKEREEQVNSLINSKHRAELAQKIAETKTRLDALHKLLHSLQSARKQLSALAAKGKFPPPSTRENLSQLNQLITSQTTGMKEVLAVAKHSPPANSVCEYLVLLNEACAAFSTFTNVAAKSMEAIVKNIVLDKVVPKTVEVVNAGQVGFEGEWAAKESAKVYASAQLDAENFSSKMGKAGFAGDCIQFATDVLMKGYCGIFKGQLTHKYNIFFHDAKGDTWWSYGVKAEAALTLRYPKSQSGDVIRMKGNIEGNATKFTFFADPDKNPEYKRATGDKVATMILKHATPLSLPVASSLFDELGFGALARAIATPAYFNIMVDAEYNTETGKIFLHINDALIDYTDLICNRQIFIQWVAGLPKLRLMEYPIHKARRTINATLRDQNEFKVQKDAKGVLSFKADLEKDIGTENDEIEHQLELSLSVKKDN